MLIILFYFQHLQHGCRRDSLPYIVLQRMVSRLKCLKNKILILNKVGKLIKDNLYFSNEHLECVKHYLYLGVYFSASGLFDYGQQDVLIKPERHHSK